MTNAEKKRHLRAYLHLRESERELLEEIEDIRSKYTGHAIQYSDMPKAHNSEHDLSEYMAEAESVLSMLERRRAEVFKAYSIIDSAIQNVANLGERNVLRYRYLLGWEWQTIADCMGYGVRQVYRIHGDALAHLEIERVTYDADRTDRR